MGNPRIGKIGNSTIWFAAKVAFILKEMVGFDINEH
jgi:hypothetical protein